MPKGDIVYYLGWFSFVSTLEESLVANFIITKVWVMEPSFFMDNRISFDIFASKTILDG